MACKVKIVPLRVRVHDRELRCDITRVVGYRAVCADHFRGPVRRSVQEARDDAREHRASVEAEPDDTLA
jgi:hypothetical protein